MRRTKEEVIHIFVDTVGRYGDSRYTEISSWDLQRIISAMKCHYGKQGTFEVKNQIQELESLYGHAYGHYPTE